MTLLKFKQGLTFIEVLYSVLILAGVMVVIADLTSGSTQSTETARRYHLVSSLMEKKLTELEFQFQQEGPLALVNEEEQVFEDHPGYSWELESQNLTPINYRNLVEDIEIENQFTQLFDQAVNQLSQIIKEVTLIIYYTKGKKKVSYSISTYFIDFKQARSTSFIPNIPEINNL